ncbi:MAG: hypothetical protein AUJ92_14590 [Armatimonadetes bacterium CG2_30_59_28]|nr:hypothetical protein [Armatimonadota bacterium]OIO92287.1 MAG: hypothetical protein AUJ92_14590 [Armatimonadetes bacterium CG2_30_59_28]PIU65309.1 MAG: hypothetical protein COS85_09320 [Armatimonadetes bacterium CG07_land_8_20_14_0_80_59_28]PIX42693.1 MAG: hypothetical protein COZ56_08820 [Armatimonadetes bacterium CG_4_8_14_3_um_filter_58_9]PIY40663.1 MAG: hypothetical protein COZ05_17070 [Armatimonadetes bacterium CG_4_10_14_3_um_filter_59_10]PJB78161.1 MAG: hypothetical protein CO095_008
MGLTIKRPVTVRAIVTPAFREKLLRELRYAAQRVEMQMQQLEFQGKRHLMDLQKRNVSQAMATRRQLEEEREKHDSALQDLNQRIEQVEQFPLGSEFVQGALESFTQIDVGDNIDEKLSEVEVIVKDDVIVEIREGRPADEPVARVEAFNAGLRIVGDDEEVSSLGSIA